MRPRFVGDVIKDVAHLIYRLEARDPVLENLACNPDPVFVGLVTRVEFVGAQRGRAAWAIPS